MSEPLIKVYKTSSGQLYAYDALTNRIVTVDIGIGSHDPEDAVKQYLLSGNIIKSVNFSKMQWQHTYDEYLTLLDEAIPSLLLQLTCRCNLSCDYCIYSGNYSHMRSHSMQDMTESVLYKSIDFYALHNRAYNEARISFYGGEALFRFDLIKSAVKYARSMIQGKELNFSISTNGITLNRQIAGWLAENPDVSITITINGPFQDKHRKTLSGDGSLSAIMENIYMLQNEFNYVWENQVRLISNIVSSADLIPLRQFYNEQLLKAPEAVTNIGSEHGNQAISKITAHDDMMSKECSATLQREYFDTGDSFLTACFGRSIAELHNRPVYDGDDSAYMSTCLPGQVKLYVYADGKFGFCESVCDKITFGDLECGFDKNICKQIYEQARELFENQCFNCWAQRLCKICLKDAFDSDGKLYQQMPQHLCEKMQSSTMEKMMLYCKIAENNPNMLDQYKAKKA